MLKVHNNTNKYIYKIKLASVNSFLLNNYLNFLKIYLKKFINLNYSMIKLPLQRNILTLLKSPHVNKKAKEQFINIKHNALVIVKCSYEIPIKLLLLNLPSEIFTKCVFTY